jgi:phospholipase C
MPVLTRRQLLAGAAGLAATGALAACGSPAKPSAARVMAGSAVPLPARSAAPFDTVVVLMMENRSFDHLLGWLPGANGRQAGLRYPDRTGSLVPTAPLGANTQWCDFKDPAHDWQSVARQYNDGRCDGWLATQTTKDRFLIGYYEQPQVPILGALAQNYTVFDNYFCSLLAPTWPNRFYQLSAATDVDATGLFPASGDPRPSKLSLTIFDRVQAAGLRAGYYTWGEPMTELFASKRYDAITYPKDRFFTDAAAGKLPNVTFIDPDYTTLSEFKGTSNDDHPHGGISAGEAYVAQVYEALQSSPQWERMIFVVNFDEHGGFYDHVPPPRVVDDNHNPSPGPHPDYGRLGFRVPAIAIGPFAPRKVESAGPYEHCSVLRMIEWRWGLAPMTARDANAKNLAAALDFSGRRAAVTLPPPPASTSTACPNPSLALA